MALMVIPTVALPGDSTGFTVDDLDAFPDDGRRYELVDGVLIVSPLPAPIHQVVAMELGQVLRGACPPELYVLSVPLDVRSGPRMSLEPDVLVVRREQVRLDRNWIDPPPLVVEVLSPSSRAIDRGLKRQVYARLGIPSYWIVDPRQPSLLALELDREGHYAEVAHAVGDEPAQLERPFPVVVVPQDLLAGFG